ncbi:MAG: DUF1631 family protein, partial [Pseudomonadota bacterium]
MSPSPTSQAAGQAQRAAPSRHALLDQLVASVTAYVNEHFMDVSGRLVASLLDLSDSAIDARSVHQRIKAGNVLKANSYAFFHLVATGLELAVRKEVDTLLPPSKPRRLAASAALSLVPFEEMDSQVAFSAVSRAFEIDYADALATLNVRLGFLLERDILRIGQNPFRPEVFLKAIHQAWCEFEPDAESHPLLQPLLKPAILFDFGPLYEDLNLTLQRKGVLPGSVDNYRIRKSDN